jgi:hypothetical protein
MMSKNSMKNILATVELPINMPLEKLAAKLAIAVGGIIFEKEETGRFDEVPAFVANLPEMEFVLFGVPDGEDGDYFVLEFSARTELSIDEFRINILEFVGSFLVTKHVNIRGYFDYSEEMANSLFSKGLTVRK